MKGNSYIKMILAGCVLSLLIPANVMSQTTVSIFYLAPTDILTASYTGTLTSYIVPFICNDIPTGYSYVRLGRNTSGIFRRIAPPRIKATYDSLTDNNSSLKGRITEINNLSDGLVRETEIFLFDDRTGLFNLYECGCDNYYGAISVRGVWPCGGNFRDSVGEYVGNLTLGELAADSIISTWPGGYWAWDEAIIHEFSHTQFAREYRNDTQISRWGEDGVAISYGGDKGHWRWELLADPEISLEEGLATYWSWNRNTEARDSLIRFLNNPGYRFWLGSHSFLTGTAHMWNALHEVVFSGAVPDPDYMGQRIVWITSSDGKLKKITLTGKQFQTGAGYEIRSYKWLDVPGEFVFNNENMARAFALLFTEFAFVTTTQAADQIYNAVKVLTIPNHQFRYPAFFANLLANNMEAYALTPDGRREALSGTLTSSMFVYALYDIITHFGISEADLQHEFRINFETYKPTLKPLAYDNYWRYREEVKQLVCPYLGGNNCLPGSTGTIDIQRAVEVARDYFRDPFRFSGNQEDR